MVSMNREQRMRRKRVYIFKVVLLLSFIMLNSFSSFSSGSQKEVIEKEDTTSGKPASDEKTIKKIKKIKKKILQTPEEVLKYMKKKEWYKQREKEKERKKERAAGQDEADLSSIKEGASEEVDTFLVLLGEIPTDDRKMLYAPVFLTEQKNIFETNTDFKMSWVGLKITLDCKKKQFPWRKTSLSGTLIGSFLFASGTNFGIVRGSYKEQDNFYTNYISEIITLKRKLPWYISVAFALDSRQYFFNEKDPPRDYKMPMNHYNIFPRFDFSINRLKETGVDQLTDGIKLSSWIGYGIRNKWDKFGESSSYESGKWAKTFVIYSVTLTSGLLFNNNHNIVLRARYKGGVDNDFLTRPRFGATIDNAKLDVVHGFTLDEFRVKRFGLINLKYGFNIFKRLRMNLFFDYAHIFTEPELLLSSGEEEDPTKDVFGSGYGFRIIAWGGLPIWITHGIGRKLYPEKEDVEHVVMVMTAAGW